MGYGAIIARSLAEIGDLRRGLAFDRRGETPYSVDATLVQPLAVGPVELFDVFEVPRRQKLEQRAEVNELIAVEMFQGRIELRQQMVVRSLVFIDLGEELLLQQTFFTLKVHPGELDEAFELEAEIPAIGSVDEHSANLIQGVHQDPVLIVHGFDADDALVTPCQRAHNHLHTNCESRLMAGTLNDAMVVPA